MSKASLGVQLRIQTSSTNSPFPNDPPIALALCDTAFAPSLLRTLWHGGAISTGKRSRVEVLIGQLHAAHVLLLRDHKLAKRQQRILHEQRDTSIRQRNELNRW